MQSTTILLDPTAGASASQRPLTARPSSTEGLTVALLDINKSRGDVFLDRVDALLNARGIATRRYMKPTFSRPAPTALRQQISAECQLVVEGLAD